MSFPRHLRKKRPKPRPNPKPGRLDLRSVKLRSSALGRCRFVLALFSVGQGLLLSRSSANAGQPVPHRWRLPEPFGRPNGGVGRTLPNEAPFRFTDRWPLATIPSHSPPLTSRKLASFSSSISPLRVLTANHSQTNAKAKLASFWRFSRHFVFSVTIPSVHSPLATRYSPRFRATRRLCHRQFTGRRGAGHRRGDAKHHPHCPDILSLRQDCPNFASVSGSCSLLDGTSALVVGSFCLNQPI